MPVLRIVDCDFPDIYFSGIEYSSGLLALQNIL